MPRFDSKLVPYLVLTLALGFGVAILYRAPVRRYVVACERAARAECVLEQTRADGAHRTHVRFDAGAAAVVRIVPHRRGGDRVFLYLESPGHALFAAEFEGDDAAEAASRAAAQLNGVLRGALPAHTRVEAVPPPLLGWLSWSALGVMALLILAGWREVRRRPAAA